MTKPTDTMKIFDRNGTEILALVYEAAKEHIDKFDVVYVEGKRHTLEDRHKVGMAEAIAATFATNCVLSLNTCKKHSWRKHGESVWLCWRHSQHTMEIDAGILVLTPRRLSTDDDAVGIWCMKRKCLKCGAINCSRDYEKSFTDRYYNPEPCMCRNCLDERAKARQQEEVTDNGIDEPTKRG